MSKIPVFIDDYHLPPGEHSCSMSDISEVFLDTDVRIKRWNDFITMLKRLCDLKLTPEILLINGSFVTGRKEPGDVDFAVLIPPEIVRDALTVKDEHDVDGVKVFLEPRNQSALRNIFGAHLLIANDSITLEGWSRLFRKGQYGRLREPDPTKDPDWVTRPSEKGIIKVEKDNIIKNIYGGD